MKYVYRLGEEIQHCISIKYLELCEEKQYRNTLSILTLRFMHWIAYCFDIDVSLCKKVFKMPLGNYEGCRAQTTKCNWHWSTWSPKVHHGSWYGFGIWDLAKVACVVVHRQLSQILVKFDMNYLRHVSLKPTLFLRRLQHF